MGRRGTPVGRMIDCSTIGRTCQSWPTGSYRHLRKWGLSNATDRLGCTFGSKFLRRRSTQKSCPNIGSSSILRGKPNTSATPRCRCSRKRVRKSCIAHSIMPRLKKRSRHHHSGHQSMIRDMALTTSSNTSLIGKVELLGSR